MEDNDAVAIETKHDENLLLKAIASLYFIPFKGIKYADMPDMDRWSLVAGALYLLGILDKEGRVK